MEGSNTDLYESPTFYGNPIIKHTNKPEKWICSSDFDVYEDKMESICYLITNCFETIEEMMVDAKIDVVSEKDLEVLLIDLVGEAG